MASRQIFATVNLVMDGIITARIEGAVRKYEGQDYQVSGSFKPQDLKPRNLWQRIAGIAVKKGDRIAGEIDDQAIVQIVTLFPIEGRSDLNDIAIVPIGIRNPKLALVA